MNAAKIRVIAPFAGLVAAVLATGIVLVQPAGAVSASCKSKLETKTHWAYYDDHRAGAYCTSIASDTMVRAKLVKNGGPDATSVWFTGTYLWRYTSWKTCAYGCWDTYELSDR